MKVIRNINVLLEMMQKTGYARYVDIDTTEPDEYLDLIANICVFLEEKREELQKLMGVPLENIIYSRFLWVQWFYATLQQKGRTDYGDGGVCDYMSHIIEDIEESGIDTDFDYLEKLCDEVNEMSDGALDAYYNGLSKR